VNECYWRLKTQSGVVGAKFGGLKSRSNFGCRRCKLHALMESLRPPLIRGLVALVGRVQLALAESRTATGRENARHFVVRLAAACEVRLPSAIAARLNRRTIRGAGNEYATGAKHIT
jgi:hypothetical protein